MTTYHVSAKRWQLGWELHIDGVGVTQARSLATAEGMAREYIAAQLDLDDDQGFDVTITPHLGDEVATEVAAAHDATRRAEQARDEAAQRARAVVHDLRKSGLSKSDVAVVLGVSTQRVSQLATSSNSV